MAELSLEAFYRNADLRATSSRIMRLQKSRSKDKKVRLSVPEQALRDSFRLISIKPMEQTSVSLPPGRQLIGSIYEFREPGERFTKEAVLEVHFSEEQLGGSSTERLGIYGYNAHKKAWEYLDSRRDETGKKVVAKVKEINPYYALMVSDIAGEGSTIPPRPRDIEDGQKVRAVSAHGHYLVRDTFEDRMGEWSNRDGDVGATVTLDETATFDGTRCVKITNVYGGGNFAVNVRKTPFDASEYPIVQFDYRIPPDVKTNFLVKVAGRWYDIGFTDDPKDLEGKRVNIANIGKIDGVVADDQWHTARFNLYDMLRTKTANHLIEEMIMANWDVGGYMKLKFGQNRKGATYYIDNFAISREVAAGLKIESEIVLVDNFNQKKETNALGGASTTFAAHGGGSLQTTFSEENGAKKGHALKLSYQVSPAGSYAGYISSLQHLDLRGYKTLTLFIKGTQDGQDVLIGLKDRSGHESKVRASQYLTTKILTTTWQKVEIPLVAFTDVRDWGKMDNLSLSFEHGLTDEVGEISVDDISFSKVVKGFRVDDFEREGGRNFVGGANGTFAHRAAAIGGRYEKASANGVYRISYGGSLGDLYTYAGWTTQLGGVDCSQCGTLSFLIKGVDGGEKPNIYKYSR